MPFGGYSGNTYNHRTGSGIRGKLLLALVIAAISVITYMSQSSVNVVTGEKQHVAMTINQEIALGLEAGPQMAAQHGGQSSDRVGQARVDAVGQKLLRTPTLTKSPYKFDFHLLADPKTVNAFALPGGQVYITTALYRELSTEAQLAGVLGHEIGHVIQRHSAQQLAKARLTQGLTGAAAMAAYDPNNPTTRNAQVIAQVVGQLVTMRYGRDDELESDRWGVLLLHESGYDPHALIEVMEILARAGGSSRAPEFFSTHPNPENRIGRIKEEIAKLERR